jgi:hypothetical protein
MIGIRELHIQSKILRVIAKLSVATICGAAAGFAVLMLSISVLSSSSIGQRDFVAYWATGQQLAHHANPYDGETILRIEHSAGFPAGHDVLFMRNPPWTLPLVFPLGFLGARAGSMLWSLLLIASLLVSVHMLWIMHGRPGNRRILLGYSFGPALVCLIDAQVAPFALLGLVMFLRLHRTHPFIAGVSLWLCALKPHLFLPFGIVLLAWAVVSKSYRLLAGAGTAFAASCAISFHLAPTAWTQYSQMMRTSGIEWDYIPCLSLFLRAWLSPPTIWLQFLPAAVGCVWALLYFWVRRDTWDWMKHGSLLMLVSILAAPYSWIFDQTLAIPALLQGAYVTRSRGILAALAFASALVEIALFCDSWKPHAVYLWTLWTAPAWLAWYLIACATPRDRT